jgi:hypothetical protein
MNEWMNECVHIPIAKEANSNSRRVRIYIHTYTHTLAHWALSFDSTDSSPNSRVYWVKDKRKFFARYCSTIHKKSSTLSKACMHVYKYTERGREWRKERVLIAARGRDYTQEVCLCLCVCVISCVRLLIRAGDRIRQQAFPAYKPISWSYTQGGPK